MELYTVYYKIPYGDWHKDITTNDFAKARAREKQIGLRGFITKIVEN